MLRSPFEPRIVVSRRGGPSKQPLSREAIVTAALELLEREGLEGMSLRKVAEALETGPATLYAYVDDLHELHALVLDRALGRVDIRFSKQKSWQERAKRLLTAYFRVLHDSRGLAQLAFQTVAVGPNMLRVIEALLALLEEAGADRRRAAWGIDLLLRLVTAFAAEQGKDLEHDPSNANGAVARALAAVSPAEYPHIHAARDELLSGAGERGAWSLDAALTGILTTPFLGRTRRKPAPARRTRHAK